MEMVSNEIISWLLEGDVSIQYQTYRDLLNKDKPQLRKKIQSEGWGFQFLSRQLSNGHWGRSYYQPKWISSHYTLLDLKNLGISPDNKTIGEALTNIFKNEKGPDGGILPIGGTQVSDVCVNGMVLNFSSYFHVKEDFLKSVVDFLLEERMQDGGFNCQSNRRKVIHSSLHTTLSVLEGIFEYIDNGYTYRSSKLKKAQTTSQEFILMHRLFRSDRTGEIINPNFLKLYYPGRWYYDILRAMDYFQQANVKFDKRMNEAIEIMLKNKTKDGLWKLPSKHPGQIHFEMEMAGKPSRWNTLRALRVLKHFNSKENSPS